MKQMVFVFLATLILASGVSAAGPVPIPYENGTYHGMYGEVENQVVVEFTLKDQVVTRIGFRNLA
jgi:hypothetical protein